MPGGQAPPPSYSSQAPPPPYSSQAPSYSSQAPPYSPQQAYGHSCSTPFGNQDMHQPPLLPPGSGMPPPPPSVPGGWSNGPPSMSQWSAPAGAGYNGYGGLDSQLALAEPPRSAHVAPTPPASKTRNVNVHIDFGGQSSSSTAPASQRLSGATAEWRALMDSARAMCDKPLPQKQTKPASPPGSIAYSAPAPAPAPAPVAAAPPALHHHHDESIGGKKKKTVQLGQRTSYELDKDRPSGGHKTDIPGSGSGESPSHAVVVPTSTDSSMSKPTQKRCSVITAPPPAVLQQAQQRSSVQSCHSEYWEDETIDEDQIKAAQKLANKLALRRGQGVVKK